ncbi:sugar porter family MFS transporter [Streptomyces sp. 110]|uniref:Sugar porter family MFS transporter n=1 Tax=Streptomyces endocoffeicus TaxID=2898945 RepID=A0ABS1Q4S9_9ACTN|nr:sugar porter family MFS transporter [Streptomyces endocoffeicus]MBL1119682.1 sugar porter family MFS transporter [Streptomyces endocoffeicus]
MTETAKTKPTSGHRAPTGGLRHVIFIAAAAAMGGFLFGYDSAVINGAVEALRDRFTIGSGTLAQVVASALIGGVIGATLAGRLADHIGRVLTMRIAAVLFTASAVGSALPFGLWDLVAWRVVGGMGIGMASVIGPAYIAEISPPAHRGKLASFQQAGIVIGIAVSQLVNWGVLSAANGEQRGEIAGHEAWQWMLGIMAVPSALYGILTIMIPESPHYLISVGRRDNAKQVLLRVEGPTADPDARIAEIEQSMSNERKPVFKDLLGGRFGLLPIVWIGIGLAAFQQLCGINVIMYYASSLWQSVGIDPSSSFFYSFTTSIINLIGTAIAMAAVDRIGRKPLALIGSVGMAISLAIVAWAFSYRSSSGGSVTIPDAQGTTALIAAHSFVLFFALSWGVVMWVLLGEMFPNRIRAAAVGLAAAAVWATNWLITVTFPSLADWSLSGAYVIYAVCAALSIPFILRWVRETKGRSLEAMSS